jgi:type II secretory pathway pseudopilin PulG
MSPSDRHPNRFADERGFTMLLTLVVLVVAGLLMTAAFTAAEGDLHLTGNDQLEKKAYYAAQAGISDYSFHLNGDVNYWTKCTEVPAPDVVNNLGENPLRTRAVPGAEDESYAIQLIPASSDTEASPQKCDPANPVLSNIEAKFPAGTFRIQSTGYATDNGKTDKRTIVATYAHTSFLNFVYYTKYETSDPSTYSNGEHDYNECGQPRAQRPSFCDTIDFITEDDIQGPMHTEDSVAICDEPIFGRSLSDAIEFKGGTFGDGCADSPRYRGNVIAQANIQTIEPPPTNTSLLAVTEPSYHYAGKTELFLHGGTMDVTEFYNESGTVHTRTTVNVPFPPKGVIYVSNKACSVVYTPFGPDYEHDTECGNVYVHGSYTTSLTIAAENDIVINGNITTPTSEGVPSTNATLGLIANNFVRVYHPIPGRTTHTSGSCGPNNNGEGSIENIEIYAAILAVNHSFIVDNYDCGGPMRNLTVHGAVAQIFRGVVGQHSGGTVVHGYAKNYVYDDRLQVESPPYFLNPVDAAWLVKRETVTASP